MQLFNFHENLRVPSAPSNRTSTVYLEDYKGSIEHNYSFRNDARKSDFDLDE